MAMTILTRGVSGRSCWPFSRRYGQIRFGNFQSIWQNATALARRNHFFNWQSKLDCLMTWIGSEVYRSVEHLTFIGAYISVAVLAWFDICSGSTYRLACRDIQRFRHSNTDSLAALLRWDGVGEVRRCEASELWWPAAGASGFGPLKLLCPVFCHYAWRIKSRCRNLLCYIIVLRNRTQACPAPADTVSMHYLPPFSFLIDVLIDIKDQSLFAS
jgi:hypothetical protein